MIEIGGDHLFRQPHAGGQQGDALLTLGQGQGIGIAEGL